MNQEELDVYVSVVDRLGAARSLDEVSMCVSRDLRRLFDFGAVVGGLARVRGDAVYPELLVHSNFPIEDLDEIRRCDGALRSPVLALWMRRLTPLAIDFGRGAALSDVATPAASRRAGLGTLIAHGHFALMGGWLTYFSFHQLVHAPKAETKRLLVRLMPHLHCALTRLCPRAQPLSGVPRHASARATLELSARQREIAHWLVQGKSNWEIAQIADTSEANVKYHLHMLMRRFGVCNRTALAFKLSGVERPAMLSEPG